MKHGVYMSNAYLVDLEKYGYSTDLMNKAGVSVLDHSMKVLTIPIGNGRDICIGVHQYMVSSTMNGEEITYAISIPSVLFDGEPMKMLTKLKEGTDIGLSNIIFKLNGACEGVVEKTDRDYRNHLLLTSHNSMGIINVMTDKQFIADLSKQHVVSRLVKDKMHMYKTLSRAFVNEITKYTEFHRIKRYGYELKFGDGQFNVCNVFWYETGEEKFLHITFGAKRDKHIDDRHVRGYNFVL